LGRKRRNRSAPQQPVAPEIVEPSPEEVVRFGGGDGEDAPTPHPGGTGAPGSMHVHFTESYDEFRETVEPDGNGGLVRRRWEDGELVAVEPIALGGVEAGEEIRPCSRLVQHDSMRWFCACGGGGPVGRSVDGIPFVNEDILAHLPGEERG
jgi:hypothetical protein